MELLLPWAALVAIVLVTVLYLKTIPSHGRRRRHTYNLPPGPKPWPVIGNLNLLGELPHHSIRELSRRHGPLMQLWFGSMPVVAGSSVEMARFFLRTHDAAFSDRPRFAVGRHTTYNYSDILWAPYGAYLRQARRICTAELFSARRVESLGYIRHEEVRALLRDLLGASGSGRVVRLRDYLQMEALGVISRMVLGKKYVETTEDAAEGRPGAPPAATPAEFRELVDEFFALNSAFNIGDYVPWLDWLDLQGYVRRMKALGKRFDRFLERVLDEHNERRQLEGDRFVARDTVDVLLQLADDPNLEVQLSRDNVKALTQDLIIGGTDTSWMTIEWAVSELLKNPELLAKATMELDRTVSNDRLVSESDLPHLPFIDSIIKETLRVHPAAPMLVPRMAREDASVDGYDIPAGTTVLVNAWAISRDPALWDAAEEFRPERFAGISKADAGVEQDFNMLPFGSGRRMCPVYNLGLKVVTLTLANLLHSFAWRLPDGVAKEDLCMEESYQLTLPRKVPLEVIVEPKLAARLYEGA